MEDTSVYYVGLIQRGPLSYHCDGFSVKKEEEIDGLNLMYRMIRESSESKTARNYMRATEVPTSVLYSF